MEKPPRTSQNNLSTNTISQAQQHSNFQHSLEHSSDQLNSNLNTNNLPQSTLEIPEIVYALFSRVQEVSKTTEGVFRISSTKTNTTNIRSRLEAVAEQDNSLQQFIQILSAECDAICVCSLVKTFIRELNDTNHPLLPREDYVKLLTWGKWVDRPEKVEKANEKLKKFVKKMSNIYKDTFDYLIETLNLVSQYENVNRMSSAALSIVIGPNLFDPSSTMKGLHENNITNRLLAYLIENHGRVFVPCRTNGVKLGTSADQSNSSQERLLDVVDGSLTRSNKSKKKKQRIEDENKSMRKSTIESLTFQHTGSEIIGF